MDNYTILSGLAILTVGVIGLIILLRNYHNQAIQWYALSNLSSIVWLIATYISDYGYSYDLKLFGHRLGYSFSYMIVGSVFGLATVFMRQKFSNYQSYLLIAVSGIMAFVTLVSNNIISDVDITTAPSKPIVGDWYFLYIITFVTLILYTAIAFLIAYRQVDIYQKSQIKLIAIGLIVIINAGVITNIIMPVAFGISWSIRSAPLLLILFSGFNTFAITRRHLFDIRATLARYFFYIVTLISLVVLYSVILFIGVGLFFKNNPNLTIPRLVTYILLAVLLVFTFQPLRNFFEKLTNHLFFRDRYDAQALIARLGDIYSSNYKLVPISTKILLEIYKTIKIERGNIIVFDQDYKEYFRANQNFMKPGKLEFRASSDTIQDFQQLFGTDTYVYDELLEGKKKFFMQHHGISLIFPLINNKKLNGYLLISSKRSGDIYNSLDVSTLSIISNDLAIALDNALSVAKIEDFNATLQHRVKSATEKLRTANKNLRALDKAKDEFLSMASHQLKTPITTIRGYSDLFITGELGKATPDQTMAARRIMTTVGNMDSTINDLLNVSRISQDRFFIQREEVDLKELIELELENLISTIEDKGLKLMTDLDPIPTQDLDKAKIRQAVMNLIDNAIYYTQEGSIKVILKLLSRSELKAIIKDQDISSTPDFSGDPEDRLYPVFQVTDTGIGVPPDKQSKLFSKFYRADNAQRTRSDGTGLGIYLVKRVVEDHGGGIFFSSPINNNKGSTFGWWVR